MPAVYFETFGCQMNQADSALVAEALARRGFSVTTERNAADVLIVNTCSVRARAEKRALARLRELAALKQATPRPQLLWVIGCMAERLGDELRCQIPGIDAVIGARRIEFIDQIIDDYLPQALRSDLGCPVTSRRSITAFVPVMRGCNNRCAYCIVPLVRGPEHSIPAAEIENQVRRLVDNGVREVTLLGQNVNSYSSNGLDFADLLERLAAIDGLARIRFTTSHPKDCSEKLIRTMSQLPSVCKHLHLPLQSGSTQILGLMNRCYTRQDYLRLVEAVRRAIPHIDLTTDVMVGFPSESESDFEETLQLMREVRFTAAFMFAFSPRPHTAAERMPDDVPKAVKAERLARLIELQSGITKEIYADMVGRKVEVLIEGRSSKREGQWIGRDGGCKRIVLTCSHDISGMIFKTTVVESSGMTLIGKWGLGEAGQ